MGTQQPKTSEEEHVVLQFRPRGRAELPDAADARSPDRADRPPPLQTPRNQPDDFRRRMLANAAAIAFTIALIAVGLWLTKNIVDLRHIQDCAQASLRGCTHLSTPPR